MIECIENSQAIASLFGADFDFSEIDLHEVVAHRDGPTLRLRFDLAAVPTVLPARWPTGVNTTQLVLSAWPVEDLQISGFATECHGVLRSFTARGRKILEFSSPGCSLRCAFSWLRVESVSGYVQAGRDGARSQAAPEGGP